MNQTDEILSIGEEVINADGLQLLLNASKQIVAYDGFEPSGRMHICQGLFRVDNIKKLTKHGITFKIWLADWFAQLNHKMDGDMKKIRKAGLLMIEIWKACGLDMDMVEIIWASEEIEKRSAEYWQIMMDIATKTTLKRTIRCTPAMGRSDVEENEAEEDKTKEDKTEEDKTEEDKTEEDKAEDKAEDKGNPLYASNIFYPVMQCADIFFLKVDICSLGMDQRKVNALAIEYCDKIKRRYKPVVLSHHMLMGLNGSTKMAKSDPDNAIFMDDDEAEVKRKIKKGFCPPGVVEGNPILEYMKYMICPIFPEIVIARKEEHGGDLHYAKYLTLEDNYVSGQVHPDDLKKCLIKYLNLRLAPVREHFKNNVEAKNLAKLVKSYQKKN